MKVSTTDPLSDIISRLPLFTLADIASRFATTCLIRATRNTDGEKVLIRIPADAEAMQAARVYTNNEYEVSRRISSQAALSPALPVAGRDLPFLVFPDSGGRFAHELRERFRDPVRWLSFAVQAANALALIHDQGIIHKAVRPENLLVEEGTVKLSGFGSASLLAHDQRTELDQTLLVDGGIAYISPEQTGRTSYGLDQRSDLYSLGIVLYELLTGQLPLRSDDLLEWTHNHIAKVPIPPAKHIVGLPGALSAIVMKLIRKLPDERYQTARGLKRDLELCLSDLRASGSIAGFPLGQTDIPEHLLFANKLYGREEEIASLKAAFARSCDNGRPHVMLVGGYSGIGKTAIVGELRQPVSVSGGLFSSGKFDQYQRGVPYTTLVQAVGELVRQILMLPDQELAQWQQSISQALGTIGRVVTDVVPEVELVVGSQPEIPSLPPVEARNRFNHVFTRFIQVFARRRHPLCLFLDDMQWADSASLELLFSLAIAEGTESLLLVFAYRDNEVQPGHPFADFAAKLRSNGVSMDELVLGPLATGDLAQLVASALRRSGVECDILARLIEDRTLGNPFFVREFLKTMNRDGLLTFDAPAGRWTWDQEKIEAEGPTENVGAMLARTVSTMDPAALATLQLASCFGNNFDFASLSTISQKPTEEVEEDLRYLIRQELILPAEAVASSRERYRFRHDQVQQAAYSLVPREKRGRLHLKIGSLLFASFSAIDREDRLFDIAGQFNLAVDLIDDPSDRERAIASNLGAARKAKASIAYGPALLYLDCAAKLLGDDPWRADRATTFALHRERAECLFVTGRPEAADNLFEILQQHAATRLEIAAIATLRVRLYSGVSRYDDAIAVGFDALHLFGIDFPTDDKSVPNLVAAARQDLQDLLGPRTLEDMLTASVMTDPDALGIMGLLGALPPSIYPRRPALFPLIAIRMLQLSLLHGNTEDSCFAYSMYAMLLVSVFRDIPGGHALSRMSIQLSERLNDRRHRCTVLHVHANHINYWREPYESNLPFIDQALRATLEAGDAAIAGHFSYQAAWQVLERGLPLDETRHAMEQYAALARLVGNTAAHEMIRLQIQLTKNLSGKTETLGTLDDATFSEADAFATFAASGSNTGFFFYHVLKMIVAFSCGQFELALQCAEAATPHMVGALALPIETTFALYRALTVARVLDKESARADELTTLLETDAEKLRRWAENCPANFRYKCCLVDAERARLAGDLRSAMRLYEDAIESASGNGFGYGAALACELTGGFFAHQGLSRITRTYFAEARELYRRVGAQTGVERLDRTDPELPLQKTAPRYSRSETPSLDLTAVLRASQAISQEIESNGLLKALMRILLLNAGADRGLLLRFRDREKTVDAAARVESDGRISVHVADEAAGAPFPATVVNYVRHTRERVVIDDVHTDQLFINDLYFAAAGARSMLCAPILKGESLIGLLYLENTLSTGAFTTEKLAALDLLSSQAAISLENADLYRLVGQSEERLRLAQQAARVGTFEWNVQTGVNTWTPELERLYGLAAGDVARRQLAWQSLVHPDDRAATLERVNEAFETGEPGGAEWRVAWPDGSIHWLAGLWQVFKDESGKPLRLIGAHMDITERKRADEELQEREERLTLVVQSADLGTWDWNILNDSLIWSSRCFALFGLPADTSINYERFLKAIHPEDRTRVDLAVRGALERHEDYDVEMRTVWPDGSLHWVSSRGRAYYDASGQALRMSGAAMAITARKEAEARIRELNAELENRVRERTAQLQSANKELEAFAYSVSHDLRSPLRGIDGWSLALLEDYREKLDKQAQQYLIRVRSETQRMGLLIDDLLQLSRITRADMQTTAIDLSALARGVAGRLRGGEADRNLEIVIHSGLAAVGDARLLDVVLTNLFGNSVKFTSRRSDGRIEFGQMKENGETVFYVRDNGVGFDMAYASTLFGAFQRLHKITEFPGTGIGLATVQRVIHRHGGRVWAEAQPNQGATFYFTLGANQNGA